MQIGPSKLVIEYPCASYDFLFGDYLQDTFDNQNINMEQVQEEFNKPEQREAKVTLNAGVAAITQNVAEQKAYLVQHNNLTTADNGDTPDYNTYRTKLLLKFNETLNYAIIYPDQRKGAIDYRFVPGPSPYSIGMKWRIAVDNDTKKVIKKNKKNKNNALDKFKKFASTHGEMFGIKAGMEADL